MSALTLLTKENKSKDTGANNTIIAWTIALLILLVLSELAHIFQKL